MSPRIAQRKLLTTMRCMARNANEQGQKERLRNMAAEKKQSNWTDKDKWFRTTVGHFINPRIFQNY